MTEKKYYLCNAMNYWDETNVELAKLIFEDFNFYKFSDLKIVYTKAETGYNMHIGSAVVSINEENADKIERMLNEIDKSYDTLYDKYVELKRGFSKINK